MGIHHSPHTHTHGNPRTHGSHDNCPSAPLAQWRRKDLEVGAQGVV